MGCTGNIKWCFMYTNRSSCISFNSLQYCYLMLHLIDVGRNWQLVGPGWLLPTLWWTVNLQGCHQDKTLTTVPITQGLRFNAALQIGEMLSFKGEIRCFLPLERFGATRQSNYHGPFCFASAAYGWQVCWGHFIKSQTFLLKFQF